MDFAVRTVAIVGVSESSDKSNAAIPLEA